MDIGTSKFVDYRGTLKYFAEAPIIIDLPPPPPSNIGTLVLECTDFVEPYIPDDQERDDAGQPKKKSRLTESNGALEVKHEAMDLDSPAIALAPSRPPSLPQHPPNGNLGTPTPMTSTSHTPQSLMSRAPYLPSGYNQPQRPQHAIPTSSHLTSIGSPLYTQRPPSIFSHASPAPMVSRNTSMYSQLWNYKPVPKPPLTQNVLPVHTAPMPTPPSSGPSQRVGEAEKPKPPDSPSFLPLSPYSRPQAQTPSQVGSQPQSQIQSQEQHQSTVVPDLLEADRQREKEVMRQKELERQQERERQLQDMRNRAAKIVDTIDPRREGLSGSNAL